MAKSESWKLGRKTIEVSNLEKIFFPKSKFTKGNVLEYYRDVADVLVPHLKDRPMTLKRYPNGIDGKFFYEKDAPSYTPDWIKKFSVARKEARGNDASIDYILVTDAASLLWTVNLANIEMHTFLAKAPKVEQPTSVVFDLDPGAPADVLTCAEVALELKALFDEMGLECVVKVSGSKGMQLYIPLNTPTTYAVTRPFAETVAKLMVERMPNLVVSNMSKALRGGKVLIDWSQNDDFKTTVVVYSMRAKNDTPYISMPVQWEELRRALKKKDKSLLYFEPKDALKRLDKLGDLFAPALSMKQRIPKSFQSAIDAGADQSQEKTPVPKRKAAKSSAARKGTDMEAYRAKRNFSITAEPPPAVRKGAKETQRFVIQKHEASHLHYDFRLEMDGVLRSWAVPKGPSMKKNERRLAMHVEDHPLDYADFEGTIPAGNYGAGTVMVWDRGTYSTQEGNPSREYHKGKLHLTLKGEKLKGEWVLVRAEDDKRWFLMRAGTDGKPISARRDDQSVITKRTMKQIRDDKRSAQWGSNRKASEKRARKKA
ncbi:MAG: non-homologous end-joining DNA ligase [Bdellovibrionota bacterium]